MKFTKPRVPRVHVEIKNPDDKSDRICFTIYETTPKETAERMRSLEQKPTTHRATSVTGGANGGKLKVTERF